MKSSIIIIKTAVLMFMAMSFCISGTVKAEDPCGLFGEDALRKICGIGSEVEVEIEAGGQSSNPYCSYEWAAVAKRKMKVGGTEIEVDQVNKVMIVYPNIGRTPAQSAFEQSTKVYPDAETVEGVGEAAVWSEKRHQLTAVVDGRLYHVNVSHHDSEEDKSLALQILEVITT